MLTAEEGERKVTRNNTYFKKLLSHTPVPSLSNDLEEMFSDKDVPSTFHLLYVAARSRPRWPSISGHQLKFKCPSWNPVKEVCVNAQASQETDETKNIV